MQKAPLARHCVARPIAWSVALFVAAMSCVSTIPGCGSGREPAREDRAAPELLASDFDALVGPKWWGTLTYLDYSSGKPTTIRSTLRVERPAGSSVDSGASGGGRDVPEWTFAIGYDDEPHANSAKPLRLIDSGRAIESEGVIERVLSRRMTTDPATGDQRVEVTTHCRDEVDKRPATIHRMFIFTKGGFVIRKLVKFDDAADFITRHECRWSRD